MRAIVRFFVRIEFEQLRPGNAEPSSAGSITGVYEAEHEFQIRPQTGEVVILKDDLHIAIGQIKHELIDGIYLPILEQGSCGHRIFPLNSESLESALLRHIPYFEGLHIDVADLVEIRGGCIGKDHLPIRTY
jgi:hypothetical protein